MNEKLIWRAATKYRTWMLNESEQTAEIFEMTVIKHLRAITKASEQMAMWAKRFFKGSIRRIQIDLWEPNIKHTGVLTPDIYKNIATHMIPDLGNDTVINIQNTIAVLKKITDENPITPLSLREAVEEVRIVSKTWENVKFREDQLSVLISDVTLEDENSSVNLGSFWIHLDLTSPLSEPKIESLDKVESTDGYYHPHVSDNYLCTGDGGLLMKDALCQGRLEDYFRIVEAILRTYNENSPYDGLFEWYNPEREGQFYCEWCNEWRDNESSCYCEGCNVNFCEYCDVGVGCCTYCSEWRCGKCSATCLSCNEVVCKNCIDSCAGCSNSFCPSCLGMCIFCKHKYCDDCTESCAYCGDVMCEYCMTICSYCKDNCCTNCIDSECSECNKDICKNCQKTCEHCGTLMCNSCEEEHNCLLAEVTD